MSNVRFELNYEGVGELLKSQEMTAMLEGEASKVLNRLPHGYGMTTGQTGQRAKAQIFTRTSEAYKDNLENNTLLKSLGGK